MRILVISDIHGETGRLLQVLRAQPTADVVFFLGDGEADVEAVRERFPEKTFLCVRGNCDFVSLYPELELRRVEDVNILACHGHRFGVKSGTQTLMAFARGKNARVVLYGHTHQAETAYEDGIYRMNPGSLRGHPASYGTLDITPAGIVPNIVVC